MSPPKAKAGPSVAAPGPVNVGGLAGRGGPPTRYAIAMIRCNTLRPGEIRTCGLPAESRLECPVSASRRVGRTSGAEIAYRDSEAFKRRYRANRGRIADKTAGEHRPGHLKNNQVISNGGRHGG